MGLYSNRLQAPTKTRTSDWIPEDGELFRDSDGNLYMGDNVTASDALTAIGGGGGGGETPVGIPYTFEATYNASGIAAGEVRVNNATAGSITTIYIAQNDATVTDFGPVLATLSAGGLVYLNTVADDTAVAVMKVTAAVDSGTYYTLTGTYLSGVMPGDGSEIRVTVNPYGPAEAAAPNQLIVSGAGTSDVNAIYSLEMTSQASYRAEPYLFFWDFDGDGIWSLIDTDDIVYYVSVDGDSSSPSTATAWTTVAGDEPAPSIGPNTIPVSEALLTEATQFFVVKDLIVTGGVVTYDYTSRFSKVLFATITGTSPVIKLVMGQCINNGSSITITCWKDDGTLNNGAIIDMLVYGMPL